MNRRARVSMSENGIAAFTDSEGVLEAGVDAARRMAGMPAPGNS